MDCDPGSPFYGPSTSAFLTLGDRTWHVESMNTSFVDRLIRNTTINHY